MHWLASQIKAAIPSLKVAASSFSQLRQYAGIVGAAMLERGEADLLGFGRQSLAYPDFANDLLRKGKMDESKVCLCCDSCFKLNQVKISSGCVIHDEQYKPVRKMLP